MPFVEETGAMLSLLVWLMFGVVAAAPAKDLNWQTVAYAVLSLTVIRMLPVAVALARPGSAGPPCCSWLVRPARPGLARLRLLALE